MTKLKTVLGTNGEIMLACTSLRGVLFGDAACVCGWVSARIFVGRCTRSSSPTFLRMKRGQSSLEATLFFFGESDADRGF